VKFQNKNTGMLKIAAYKFLLFHVLLIAILYYLFYFLGLCTILPSDASLLQWDANWYNSIQLDGYWYSEKMQSNSGFYPLFPALWNLLGCGAFAISCLNACICLLSIALLVKYFQISPETALLFLSLPSIFFLYVPYAESIFFLGATITLVGLKRGKNAWILIGILIASLSKATAIFFVPSGLFMLLTMQHFKQIKMLPLFLRSILLIAIVTLGTMLVVAIQYQQTGVWMAYFKSQSMQWNRSFTIPVFPLTTWDAHRLLTLDAAAFLVGVVALFLCLRHLWSSVGNNLNSFLQTDKAYLFSCAFLVMVLASILFFNPLDAATNTTSILSINRYMIASPFLLVFLHHHVSSSRLTQKELFVLFGLLLALGFIFNAYSGKRSAFLFFLLIGYCMSYLTVLYKPFLKKYWLVLYFINCCFQLFLFNSFLEGQWVG